MLLEEEEHGQASSWKSVHETGQVYLLYDEDYNNDTDIGGEDSQNKFSVLVGIYLQPPISNCTNKTCRHINYFCLLSCLIIKFNDSCL
jgi:hypothetical protein